MTQFTFLFTFMFLGFANADVYNQLERIAPHLSQREKLELATDIVKVCEQQRINCQIFTAVLAQESMFRTSAFNHRTLDYGIGQVNIRNIASLKLDKHRLLNDRVYSLTAAAQIFGYFQRRYGAKEALWYCRFNVGSGKLERGLGRQCAFYADAVKRFL